VDVSRTTCSQAVQTRCRRCHGPRLCAVQCVHTVCTAGPGAVVDLSRLSTGCTAKVGRGADGVDAMAQVGHMMLMGQGVEGVVVHALRKAVAVQCVHTKCRLHIAAACCCGCCGTLLVQRHTGQREALGVELLRGFVALCVVLDRVWYCACVDCHVLQDKACDAVN
jgi:hypothetical protein